MKLSTIILSSVFGLVLGTSIAFVSADYEPSSYHTQATETVRPVSPPTSIEVAGSIAKVQPTIEVPEVKIVGDRPVQFVVAKTRKPCDAHDEGTRDLEQGSGTVHTYTFCN